jgi:hypothetical protein
MKYEEIELQTLGGKEKHIIIDLGDGSFKSFPADENNPEYMAWKNPPAPIVIEEPAPAKTTKSK